MAKKTLGYTELQWTCRNCTAINPGPEKTCTQCGAPQPDDVVFEQVKGAELIQNEAVKTRVKAGPDIHCPYCEARNPGDAKTCTQCGGDLVEGERRKRGEVLGAYKKETLEMVSCPHCATNNLETAKICSNCGGSMHRETVEKEVQKPTITPSTAPKNTKVPIVLAFMLVLVCVGAAVLIFLSMRTKSVTGSVERVVWKRSIAIEGLVPVEYHNWLDSIPDDGEILGCQQEVRYIEEEPQPKAQEICGTPYSVDTGSGYAEVVQDCEYHVYDDYCSYSVLEWTFVENASETGSDFYPEWPEPILSTDQRAGDQTENYLVYFDTDQGEVTYSAPDFQTFQRFEIGSLWDLEINSFGGVVSVSP